MGEDGVAPVPGVEGWRYGAFAHDQEAGTIKVPVVRPADSKSAAFVLPDFVNDPDDIARVARIVIDAVERWERVEGLGA